MGMGFGSFFRTTFCENPHLVKSSNPDGVKHYYWPKNLYVNIPYSVTNVDETALIKELIDNTIREIIEKRKLTDKNGKSAVLSGTLLSARSQVKDYIKSLPAGEKKTAFQHSYDTFSSKYQDQLDALKRVDDEVASRIEKHYRSENNRIIACESHRLRR